MTAGVIAIAIVIPVFIYRHYVQDKGVFPAQMLADLSVDGQTVGAPKAGVLPYVALGGGIRYFDRGEEDLGGGILSAAIAYMIFWT